MATLTLDTSRFEKALRQLGKPVVREEIARAIMAEWFRLILLRWPVDTGRSRGGFAAGARWVGLSVTRGRDAKATAEGRALSTRKIRRKRAAGMVVEVTNAVPYAADLEKGTSLQAPLGAVEISAREVEQGTVPRDVSDVYEVLWRKLKMQGDRSFIRAQDVKRAMKKLKLSPADVRAALG